MRIARLSALVLMAIGGAAQAQSPLMYYPPMYAPRPAAPYYYMPARHVRYAPQPQPRVVYVPASADAWHYGHAPVAAPLPAGPAYPAAPTMLPAPLPAGPTAPPAVAPGNDADPFLLYEGSGIKADKPARGVSGKTVAFGKHHEIISGPLSAGPDCADPYGEACHVPMIPRPSESWLPRGCCNIQFRSGFYFNADEEENFNWVPTSVRIGRVWKCEHLPGAFEPMIDVTGGVGTDTEFGGNWFIGPSLILRYNFCDHGCRLVPYIQAGAGALYNAGWDDPASPQGSRIELTAGAQVGCRLFLCKSLSLDLEGGYQHIANGGMAERNEGLHGFGATFGLTYFFGRHQHH